MSREPGILFAGTAPFDSPWLTDQNLANVLSWRAQVLYVEPHISPLTPFRSTTRTRMSDLLAPLREPTRTDGNLSVMRPIAVPPLEHTISRRLSAPLVRRQVRRSVAEVKLPLDAAVLARRLPLPARPGVVCYLVKDWTPAGADLVGRSEEDLVGEIRELAASADIVLAISVALQSKLAEYGIESGLLRHGFHAKLAPMYDEAETPPDLASLPRPLLMYAGRIDARLDMATLNVLAERFHTGSLVLVGPTSGRLPDGPDIRRLRARGNVHWLGSRDRLSLPAYLAHADCLLLPYAERDWSRFGSPLKLWDYLYAGPPLVGSGYTVLAEYSPALVYFAHDRAAFPELVDGALAEGRAGATARKQFALANTWAHRSAELLGLLGLA